MVKLIVDFIGDDSAGVAILVSRVPCVGEFIFLKSQLFQVHSVMHYPEQPNLKSECLGRIAVTKSPLEDYRI
jgi:hypothetical protein